MGEIEERLARHAAVLERDAAPLTEQEVIGRERRPGPIARPLAMLAAAVIALVAIGVPALFLFTGEEKDVAPSTSLPATTVPGVVPPTLPDPVTTVPGPPTTEPGPGVVDPNARVVRGAPMVAVADDDSILVAWFETAIGPGNVGTGFGDGREFAGEPQATTIVFRTCADPSCAELVTQGVVPVRAWSERLAAGLASDGSPRFAYWDWGSTPAGEGEFLGGGTYVVTCLDPACSDFGETFLVGETPGPVRVVFDDTGEPVAVAMVGDVLSVVRGDGEPAGLGLPPSPNWPFPDLAVGPGYRPLVVVDWPSSSNAYPDRLFLLVCSDPGCMSETTRATLASWQQPLWKPFDVAGIVSGSAGDIRVPFAFWEEGCPRCMQGRDWAEPWTGEIRIAACDSPGCVDPAIEVAAVVPGLVGTIGAGVAADGRTIVGWTACPQMVSGLSLNQACPVMHAVAATCDAVSCEEMASVPVGNPDLSYLVGMVVTPDGSPVFHWAEVGVVEFESGGVIHLAACDEPECGTITDRVIAP